MHNSQDNVYMAKDDAGAPTASTYGHLTRSSCVGCHTGTWGDNRPLIDVTTAGGMRAGGFFDDTVGDRSTRHDPIDMFENGDGTLMATPGNAESGITLDPDELMCAGATGCHGDHDALKDTSDKGIAGFHHGSNMGYRFLWLADGTKIDSLGSPTYEYNAGAIADAGDHNVYYDDADDGISKYCSTCHDDFHGTDTGSSGAWVRHPSAQDLPGTWTPTVDYVNNPFSFPSNTEYTTDGAYGVTGAMVSCLSCHRAHGTANADLLRFDYATQVAGGDTEAGCLGCHDAQR